MALRQMGVARYFLKRQGTGALQDARATLNRRSVYGVRRFPAQAKQMRSHRPPPQRSLAICGLRSKMTR